MKDIIELAREAGFPIPEVPADKLEPALRSVLERFARLHRNAVLEEAAGVCDAFESDADQDAGVVLSSTIRALKEKQT